MPFLDFKGKSVIYSHHLGVPFRTLKVDAKKSLPQAKKTGRSMPSLDDNLVIHGDNLHALKALLPKYSGKVKCVYIDPPYNTGNEGWKYNDKVNSPMIKEWLKQNGIGTDDQERHDKWLCMMWPRLQLLKELLSDDGVIFVSIDENEVANLKQIMNEVFNEQNLVAIFTWLRKKKGSFLSSEVRKMTEFILCYKKDLQKINLFGESAYLDKWQPIVKRTNSVKHLLFPKNEIQTKLKDGIYKKGFHFSGETAVEFLNQFQVKNGIVVTELKTKGKYVWNQDFLDEELYKGTEISLSSEFGFNVLRHNQLDKIKAPSTLIDKKAGVGTNEDATKELISIFQSFSTFQYNKPSSLIKFLIKSVSKHLKNSIILDSFAGSGTTAHAVLDLNKEDGGNRKFILVECEDYADKITAERVRRVIKGVPTAKDEKLKKGLGGSFTYCSLGDEINAENMLKGKLPDYKQLAEYIFYTATGKSLSAVPKISPSWFIGETENYSFHLVYKPDVDFLRSKKSALHLDLAEVVQKFNKDLKKISLVYAPASYITQKNLKKKYKIQFCQLPTAIHKIIGI